MGAVFLSLCFAIVGTVAVLFPNQLQSLAIRSSGKMTPIPLLNPRGWVRSRYYVPTTRLIGVVSLLAAAFVLWSASAGPLR